MTTAAPSPLDPELERWIAAFRGPLVGLLASWGADWAVAEELAMDTFAEAWLARDRFRPAGTAIEAIGPWLRGIAFHLLQAERRRAQRRPQSLADREPVAPSADAGTAERCELLRTAFAQIQPEQQQILRMHYLETTTARAIAALLGTTQKAIERRLAAARQALRAVAARLDRGAEVRR